MKIRRVICALLAVLLCLPALALGEGSEAAETPNTALPIPRWKDVAVHDPSIIKADDGYYYIYGSHMAAARSEPVASMPRSSRAGPSPKNFSLLSSRKVILVTALMLHLLSISRAGFRPGGFGTAAG